MENIILNTPCGAVKGNKQGELLTFFGIKYASSKRFENPVRVKKFDTNPLDATKFGAACFQQRAFEPDSECNPFYHKEFRRGLEFSYSEDCLYLNIYAKEGMKNAPVVIYIHGGSFTGGSADEGHVSGREFCENGVIFVSINYRLGPFGFCAHEDLTNLDGTCGNFGLMDQTEAILWVCENISAFGGDSENITLLGQSAGAMSVDIHLSNELLKGKIKGAILSSGAGLQRFALKPLSPKTMTKFWNLVQKNANAKTFLELKEIDPKSLFYAWQKARKQIKLDMPFLLPCVDGKIIKKGQFDKRTIPPLRFVLGVTKDDMMPIILQILAKKWFGAAKKNGARCFIYNFMRDLPGDKKGAWHASDLLYMFNTLSFSYRPMEDVDRKIARELSSSMCAFAKTGDPNSSLIPKWHESKKTPMHFCENTHEEKWKTAHNICQLFNLW